MLFDLRSRGRRRTVQVIYLGLALIMGGGLVLFGVGTGSGNGGLLNAFTGGGGGNQQGQVISQQEKDALRQTKQDPNSPAAWAALIQARYENASSSGFDTATNSYTTAGKQELAGVASAWQRYQQLTENPDANLAILAANAYGTLGQYPQAASAWEAETLAQPSEAKGFQCLAMTAYAAHQTRKGDLAAARAVQMVPAAERTQLKNLITASKTNPALAQQC